MAIAILVGRNASEQKAYAWFIKDWQQSLLNIDPTLDIRVWPALGNLADIDFLLLWNHPLGVLTQFSHLKLIASLAAGVDHLFSDPDIPTTVPIVRVVDPYMANDIVQYVTAYALQYIKLIPLWAQKQQQQVWFREPPFSFADKTIGLMGLGHLGGKAAHVFHQLGLNVTGWSQSCKQLAGIKHFHGKSQLATFLSLTDILICMLPLTPDTRHILNHQTFEQLRKGAYLINVGRGQHLVEEDLLVALNTGQLSGACLDVFHHEPLPAGHPFWLHPRITVTPHIAAVTNAATAAPQLLENYQRILKHQPLQNQVDVGKGY